MSPKRQRKRNDGAGATKRARKGPAPRVTPKKRNAADLTGRNNDARKGDLARLDARVDDLSVQLDARFLHQAKRLDALEAKPADADVLELLRRVQALEAKLEPPSA